MKHVIGLIAGLVLTGMAAQAQEFRCENGELVGGDSGITARCTTNKAGQIISVTPYKSTARQSVRIYPSDHVRSHPVQTYTPKGKRVYAPTPLTPQKHVPPPTLARPSYTNRTTTPTTTRTIIRRTTSPNFGRTQPKIITAAPTPHIQRAAYAAPCNFKIREVNAPQSANRFEVCHTDIDPTNNRAIRKLYSRLKKASRRACGTDYDSILTRWSNQNAKCAAASLDRAVMTSGIDPLRAYHLSRTGRTVPRVTVGQIRDGA